MRTTRIVERAYFNVVYRTEPDARRAVVPAPLEFDVMHMGDVDGYGPYTEAGQVVKARFDGEDGDSRTAPAARAGVTWFAPRSPRSPRSR
ncbi:acetoacetate decarboxylase family protein [Saccharopolyspora spinosa]|uniref:acetoacetate decarboxylase family protein n=1 Tax=Saccharopolyspora spinosa TaxID=60894 RepID=UPI000237B09C